MNSRTVVNERLNAESAPYAYPRVPTWKRVLDISLIVLALPVLLPVGFFISLLIKFASSGPIIFKQERIGLRGSRFMCFKFRTMHVNADTGVHQGHLQDLMKSNRPMVKLDAKGDRRLIRGGILLRSFGLDELPQLINVLRGDMSLVGPRPAIPYEYEQFLPRHRRRCETLPGLTGLWQVNGKNLTTFEQMIDFDLQYVERKSVWLDLKIIFLTIPAMVNQAIQVRAARRAGGQVRSPLSSPSIGEAK